MDKLRKVLAFLVGPLVGALCVVVPDMLVHPIWASKLVEPAVLLALLWAFGTIVSIVLGLPLLLLLHRLNRLGYLAFAIAGAFVGVTVYLFVGLTTLFMPLAWALRACVFPALAAALACKALGGWSPNTSSHRTPLVRALHP